MKKSLMLVFVLAVLCATSFAQRKYVGWSTGYHTTWGGQNIANMYFKAYTHICWFDGGIHGPSTASEGLAFTSTCHNNNTKAIVCIGGAGGGPDFKNATTGANRAAYIASLVSMMQTQGFDGIDMDWEDSITPRNTLLCTRSCGRRSTKSLPVPCSPSPPLSIFPATPRRCTRCLTR
jgi:hypothetical protein